MVLQGTLLVIEIFLTVFKFCVLQVLGTLEQLLPALLDHLLDLHPSPPAQTLNPPVVQGGPLVTVDEDETDAEDEEVDCR